MTAAAMLGVTFEFLANEDFWINVGVLATTYGVFALGIQLNIGTTGIFNFGQAGFMAVGSYTMGILVVKSGASFWLAILAGLGVAAAAAILVGLPSLRLRADYFAISTLAFSEIVRYIADNWDGLTGGNLGLFGYTDAWNDLSARIDGWLGHLGIAPRFLLPLLVVNLAVFLVLAAFVAVLVRSPWGRVLNAIRDTGELSEESESAMRQALEAFKETFAPSEAAPGSEAAAGQGAPRDAVREDVGWERLSSEGDDERDTPSSEPSRRPEGGQSLEEGSEPGGSSPKVPDA